MQTKTPKDSEGSEESRPIPQKMASPTSPEAPPQLLPDMTSLLDVATDGLYITDASGRLLAANDLFARMIGEVAQNSETDIPPGRWTPPSSLSVYDWNGQWSPEEIQEELAKNLSLPAGGIRVFETIHKRRDGSIFPVEVSVRQLDTPDGPILLHFVRDITRRREAISALNRFSRYDAIRREATFRAFSATSLPEFMEDLCRICTREEKEILLAFICRPDENGVFEFLASAGRTGFLEGSRIVLNPSLPQGQGPTAICYREGRPVFNAPLADVAWEAPWKERAIRFKLRSLSTLPIFLNDHPWGVLALGHGDPKPVDPPLANLLTELAETVSRGIDRLERRHKEREHDSLIAVLINNTDAGILLLEEGRILEANGTLARMLGYDSPEELRECPADHVFAQSLPALTRDAGATTGETIDVPLRKKDGTLLLCDLSRRSIYKEKPKLSPLKNANTLLEVVSLRDSRLRHQTIQHLHRISHFRSLLAKAAEAMAEAPDEQTLFEKICQLAVEHAQIALTWIGRPGPDGVFHFLARWGRTDYLDKLTLSIDPGTPSGMSSPALTFREGRTIVQPSFIGPLAPRDSSAAQVDLAANITLPIHRGGRVDAVLTAYHKDEDAFDPELREILEELAKNLSRGLDRLDMARDRQRISAQNEAILSSPAMGILLVSDGRIRQANPKMQELLGGISSGNLLGKSLTDLFDKEDLQRIVDTERRIQAGKSVDMIEVCGPAPGGRWIALSGVLFPGEGGGLLWTAMDITSKRQAQEDQRLFANALRSLDEGVIISDPKGTVLYANLAFENLTGYSSTALVGKNCRILQGPETDPDMVREIRQALERGQRFRKPLLNYRKDGSSFWNLLSLSPLRNAAGVITHYVGTQNDITDVRELQSQNEQLAFLSRHDPLTGLANRTALEEHLDRTLSRENRTRSSFAVGMIDLDDFKPVNDTWGHQAGDQLLREIARRLTAALRHHDLAVRLGGDEFVIVVEDLKGGEKSPAFPPLLERIHTSLTAPFVLGAGISTRIGISMGVAFFPEDGTTPDALLRAADTVLGHLKERKNDRTRWWGTIRDGLSSDDARREEQLPFGGEVRRLLAKHATLLSESIQNFVRDFYQNLPKNKAAAAILSHLSPRELEQLARGQEEYLTQLLSPESTKQSVVASSQRIGQIHFLTGVSSSLLVESTALYRRLLASHLRRSLLYDRERRILLEAADQRIETHIATEIQSQNEIHSAYIEAILSWGASGVSTKEAAARILDLPGIVGIALLTKQESEKESVATTWGAVPEGFEKTMKKRLPEVPIETSFSLDSLEIKTHNPALRSALSLYTREGEISRRLFLFGEFPNQFASNAMRQLALILHSRLPLTPKTP